MSSKRVVSLILPAVSGSSRNLVRGIADYAAEQGDWHLVLHLWGRVSRNNLDSVFRGDGLLFEGYLAHSDSGLPDEVPIPAVGMQDPKLLERVPVVCGDLPAMGRMAADYLAGKGLTRLAYVSYDELDRTEAGFREGAATAGLPVESYYLRGDQIELEPESRRRLLEWFESLAPPTGVLFREDYLAYKIMDWLPREWIPERLALLGVGNDPLVCGIARPTLSSIERDARAIGRRAAELLHRRMDGEEVERKLYPMPPGHVVERQTTGLDYTPDPLVTRAVRRMEEHLEDPPSTPELCRQLGASRRTLERRFKEVLGLTVWEQRRHLQIRRAKELLRNGDRSLAYISDSCGFSSPQQFSKAFKESVGITPRDYRRTS